MMAMLSSAELQVAVLAFSYVRSLLLAMCTRLSKRMMLTTQVRNPSAKTTMSARFCFRPMLRCLRTGIGRMTIAKSVTTCIVLLTIHSALRFTQVPGVSGSQNLLGGRHRKMVDRTVWIARTTTKPSSSLIHSRILVILKRRWY